MGDCLPPAVHKSESESIDYANIPQFDGNITSLSYDSSISVSCDSDPVGQPIETVVSRDFREEIVPPPVWHEQYTQREDIVPVRQTIRRNSKLLQCLSLPIIAVSNV